MPNPPKVFIHGTLVFVTTRTEEGLPLVPTKVMKKIIKSVLGTAHALYPVKVVDFDFELNHFHMILVVEDPEDVPHFVGYVKQEISHRVNRLLDRRKRTLWAEGYDSPIILDAETALKKIVYTLLNPVLSDIIQTMDEYPGLNSLRMLKEKQFAFRFKRIPRDSVPTLRDPKRPWLDNRAILDKFEQVDGEEQTFTLCPYAWKHCFTETANLSDEEIHAMMLKAIEEELALIAERRKQEGKISFPSSEAIEQQSMLKTYEPKKFGKRMLCLAAKKATRLPFIKYVKSLLKQAKDFKDKSFSSIESYTEYPPGLFRPGRSPVASILRGTCCYG